MARALHVGTVFLYDASGFLQSWLADLAVEVNLERDAFLAALDDPIYIRQVEHDIYLAQQYGLNGVPAMVFENQYLVSGAQPLPVLRQVVDRLRLMEGDGDA